MFRGGMVGVSANICESRGSDPKENGEVCRMEGPYWKSRDNCEWQMVEMPPNACLAE